VKAVVVAGHGKIEIREMAVPKPGPFEALVKIEACGLCGTTDRHIVEGKQAHHPADRYPAVLGHESVGTVTEVGPLTTKFIVGDRVTRPVAVWPGTCQDHLYSAWGGFAEYGIVRDPAAPKMADDYTALRQHVVPSGLSLENAVLAVSVSEVASWMAKLGKLHGKTIVIGGTGFAACVMCQCARAGEARHVIVVGRSPKKFEWVLRNGATEAIRLDEKSEDVLQKITGGKADWFLDAAGHQEVFDAGLHLLKPGGALAIYGAPEGYSYRLPLGAVGGDFSVHFLTPNDHLAFEETCRQMATGRLKGEQLLTHVWSGLNSIGLALDDQAAGHVLKGLILI
jgi:threonine dehydrogenase-like Zn-dependent dehydrogenase